MAMVLIAVSREKARVNDEAFAVNRRAEVRAGEFEVPAEDEVAGLRFEPDAADKEARDRRPRHLVGHREGNEHQLLGVRQPMRRDHLRDGCRRHDAAEIVVGRAAARADERADFGRDRRADRLPQLSNPLADFRVCGEGICAQRLFRERV